MNTKFLIGGLIAAAIAGIGVCLLCGRKSDELVENADEDFSLDEQNAECGCHCNGTSCSDSEGTCNCKENDCKCSESDCDKSADSSADDFNSSGVKNSADGRIYVKD